MRRVVAGTSLVFDRVLPRGARVELVPEVSPDTSIEARCRVHGETLSVLVHRHPYSAVTAADGSFEIDFVPDGEHLAEAWHPLLGRKTARVSVKGGRAAKLRFDFSGTRPPPAPR